MNRLLGASEHLLWLLAQTKPINVVVCATITGALSIEHLKAALAKVQHRHPLLGVKIIDYEQPRFVSEGVSSIPLRVIERLKEEHWCQEVEAELHQPFSSSEAPLIRVVLLHSPDVSELIVTFDHCIGDGLSGAYLIRDILNLASQPDIMPQRLPEPRSCEELISLSAKYDQLQNLKTAKFNLATAHRTSDEIQKQHCLLHWCLEPEETDKLVSCCRQEQTSVHGALCASFLLSIAQQTTEADEAFLKCMSPLNLRNHLVPPIGEDFGAYYTRELTYHKIVPGSDFWEIARSVKQQLNRVLTSGTIFAGVMKVNAFLLTKPDANQLRQYAIAAIASDLTVTNLGRLNIPEQFGSLQLQQLHFTVAGIAPIIVGVATLAGKMFVTFRYLNSAIPPDAAAKINRGAMQRLREAVG